MQLTRLGPYEIGKPLGKGGMGSVYEAWNVETRERVAVKALTPQLAMAEGFRERFEAEIESLKVLRHEGIVRLYGYGEQDGVLFYSMELVDGVSLEDELRAGRRFNWREVTNIAIQMSLALKHAHDHGIVHRDIKPANILLYDDEKVKLADFGIARLFGMNQLTTAGGVLGTADYMSPEQADGRPVTARCDQYSLGGVMYALLAGRPPFHAKHLPQMLQLQRFAQPEPVRRYAPDTPEQLERVIGQLLAKDPADRFPNMQVLARHLQAMIKALSRPTADDFALSSEASGGVPPDANWDPAISIEETQADPGLERRPRAPGAAVGNGVAAGSAEPAAAGSGAPVGHDSTTLAVDELGSDVKKKLQGPLAARPPSVAVAAAERRARFTTVEEDEARRRLQQQRSWWTVAGQLAVLVAVLGVLGSVAFYLSRPPSADELYRAVMARSGGDDVDSRMNAEGDVNRFLALYADDPRAAEVRQVQERIDLDKFERRLRRTGGAADPSLLPIEQMYLRAMQMATNSPAEAVEVLESIVALYPAAVPLDGAGGGDDASQRTVSVVELARREAANLRAEAKRQANEQRAALGERMRAAAGLSATDPQQAAGMYRAIIELYQDTPWATEIVADARERLNQLEGRP